MLSPIFSYFQFSLWFKDEMFSMINIDTKNYTEGYSIL